MKLLGFDGPIKNEPEPELRLALVERGSKYLAGVNSDGSIATCGRLLEFDIVDNKLRIHRKFGVRESLPVEQEGRYVVIH